MLDIQSNAVATVPFSSLDQAGHPVGATSFVVTPGNLARIQISPNGQSIEIIPTAESGEGTVTVPGHKGEAISFKIVAPGAVVTTTFTEAAATFGPKAN